MEADTSETDAAGKLTRREKGPFLSSRFAVFWYLRISIKALVPGRNLLFGADAPGSGKVEMVEQMLWMTFFTEEMEKSSRVHITNNGRKANL